MFSFQGGVKAMVNELRTVCEKRSHTSKKHKKDIMFNSNPEVGSDTGEKIKNFCQFCIEF